MAREVILAPAAERQMNSIWDDSHFKWGLTVANTYLDLVTSCLSLLGDRPELGRPVPQQPSYFKYLIQKRAKRDGHWVVYRYDDEEVVVIGFVHTKLDFEKALESLAVDEEADEVAEGSGDEG